MSSALKLSTANIEEAVAEDPKLARAISKLKQLDKDNNNELSLSEVAACVQELADSEKERNMLRKLVIAMTVLMLLFAAAIVGLTYAIVDLSKDTQVSNGVLQPKDGGSDSLLSTGAARTLHDDGAGALLSLTSVNASSLHSLMIPCSDCGSDEAMDVYNVQHVKIHTPGQLVAVYTGSGDVVIADADVGGLQVFNSTASADEYLQNVGVSGVGAKRRSLLGKSGGSVITTGGTTSGGTTTGLTNRDWKCVASSSDGKKLLAVAASTDYIYTSSNSGVTWVARQNAGKGDWMSAASSADGTKLVVAARDNYVYTSSDSGVTWVARQNAGQRIWQAIASSSDGTKLIAGADRISPDRYSVGDYLYTSVDGGATWTTRLNDAPRIWLAAASSSDGTKLFAGAWDQNPRKSSDSGGNWTEIFLNNNVAVGLASSADGSKIIAGNFNGYVWTSSNSGSTWKKTTLPSGYWYGVAASSDGTKFVAAAEDGYIYTSSDSGATWTARTSAGTRLWKSIASSSTGAKLVAVVSGGNIYTSSDSGSTWTARF